MHGNTSINPFFYGTYLAETKPNEPVTRSKQQAFQADAVGAAHQLTPSHFEKPHTFRLEWQPGPGGRLDWFVKNYKVNSTTYMDGDGDGQEWLHAYSLKDENIQQLMGSQIPIEPTYLIFNVAVSSTWGFPYDVPEWCPKCYDCDDPKCACSFYPGFCQMLRSGKTAMYIDYIRLYQSTNDSAHVGAPHTLGCDPPEYPTSEWIHGHEYRYMRNPPFSFEDTHPLRRIQNGGGACTTDDECGANINSVNHTAEFEKQQQMQQNTTDGNTNTANSTLSDGETSSSSVNGRGRCVPRSRGGLFGKINTVQTTVCECNVGYTGPHCLSIDHIDETPKAHILSHTKSPFSRIYRLQLPGFLLSTLVGAVLVLIYILVHSVRQNKKFRMLAAAKYYVVSNNTNNNNAASAGGSASNRHDTNNYNPPPRHLYGTGVQYHHTDDPRTAPVNEKVALISGTTLN
jgi:Beta-glucan synthesis-associated protein SKN1/KRE6/Sbg1